MACRHILLVCASVLVLKFAAVSSQNQRSKVPLTRFTCAGRGSGYYADVDTGCQVYHMCDGLGRQFSYKCPNMTLFQQRMLICDHWYMVNCSMSERDYDANLLIGQRDKPFVSDEEMRLRTPRPDILSAPPYNPYYDILREETKFPEQLGNSIVGAVDTSGDDDGDLDSGKRNYRPPTSWSTGTRRKFRNNANTNKNIKSNTDLDSLDEAASQEPDATFRPTPGFSQNITRPNVTPPSIELIPPAAPTTASSNIEDPSVKPPQDPVFTFIKRFDPTSPDVPQTAMSKTEIQNLNEQLPAGPANSEEDRTPRKHKNFENGLNTFKTDNDKSFSEGTRFNSVNTKSSPTEETSPTPVNDKGIPEPERVLLPPKSDPSPIASTTVGPPIYYEWKWAVPAFDLQPPKEGNQTTSDSNVQQTRSISSSQGKSPFSSVTRPEPKTTTPEPSNTEYNISSYFIPDYLFPLDKAHPGYESDDAETSFQVKIAREGRQTFGENPKCPQCHPAYLQPGSCEPCIVKR